MTSKTRGRIATAAVFAFFSLIYFSTLYKGISPGPAAHSVASALGLESGAVHSTVNQIAVQESGIKGTLDFASDPQSTTIRSVSGEFRTRHLIWRIIVRLIAGNVPKDRLPAYLNGMSALLGAMTVALAFALCRGLILFINFHDSPVSAEGRKISAAAAGIATAIALGLSAPFWLAATRAMPYAFDAFLAVLMAWLVFSAMVSQRTGLLFIFGILCGIHIFESDTGLLTAILLLALAVRAMIVGALMRVKTWCQLLSGLILGTTAYIVAAALLFNYAGGEALLPIRELLASIHVSYSLLGGGIFRDQAKLITVLFVILPFFAMCCLAMWRDAERNTAASGFLLFLLACTTIVSLTKTPLSPWGVYSSTISTYLPVTVSILAAATAGYLAAAGGIMAEGRLLPPPRPRNSRRRAKDDDISEASVGRVLCWFILFLSLACGLFNWREIRDGQENFVAKVASEFVDRLGNRSWIVSTTPELDTMVRLEAWGRGRPLNIIGHGRADGGTRRMRAAIDRDEAFRDLDRQMLKNSLLSTNLDVFVSTWIGIDDRVGSRLLLDSPQPWIDAGRIPLPAAIGYRTLEKGESPDWNAIASEHLEFWRAIGASDSILGAAAPRHLRQSRSEIRAYLCGIGEFLADQLVKNGNFPATRIREILDAVEDVRLEPQPTARNEMFF